MDSPDTPDLGMTQPPLVADPFMPATQPTAATPPDPTPVAPAPDPLRDADRAALQSSMFVASKRPRPAQWASILKVSQRLGLAPDLVARNMQGLAQHADNAAPDLDKILNDSPGLAQWLQHPDNAALGRHEIEPLARVDQHTRTLAGAADATGDFLGTSTATGMADLGAAAGHLAVAWGLTSPHQAAQFVADMNQRAKLLRDQAPDYAKEFSAAMTAHGADVDKALHATLDAQSVYLRQDVLGALARYVDPSMQAGNEAHTLGDVLSMIGAAAKRPRGLAYAGLEGLASMAPMLGGAAAGGAAGASTGSVAGPMGAALGGMIGAMIGTFAGMAPVNVGSEINAELTKRGVDITDPVALERAFSDPQLMASIRAKAEASGVTNAAVASLFTGFAGKLAHGAEGIAAKTAAHAADMGVQAAGMGVAQGAGDLAKGEKPSVGSMVQTAITTLGASAGMEAIGASRRAEFGADPVDAAVEATQQAHSALQAHRDAAALEQIGQAVKDAPTTAGIPEKVKQLVEAATGGDENAQVYFQSDDWNKYWADKGAAPAKAAADILGDGGKSYYEAQATGAPLAMPLADYVAHVAPTEHWDALLDKARTTPDGMSLLEAKDYLESLPATMKEIADEAVGKQVTAREQNGSGEQPGDAATQVGENVRQQLQSAGLTESAAKAQAQLYESTFRALGQRTGVDPLELYNRYGVVIQRGRAELQRQAATKAATDAETHLSGLSDEARAAVDEEDPTLAQAAPELARPRSEGGRLKNLTKASLDELANEYALNVDANAEEARGATVLESDVPGEVYVGMKEGAMRAAGRVAARAKTIAKLEAEIARRGLDASDVYVRGNENARNLDAGAFDFGDNSFGQAAFHGSPHVFDRFSLHAMGTGEGAQAYGWGLYFAGRKEIAKFYRDTLSTNARINDPELARRWSQLRGLLQQVDYLGFDSANQAIDAILKHPTDWAKRWDAKRPVDTDYPTLGAEDFRDDIQSTLDAFVARQKALKGRLYHVEIPDDHTMLDWDKPMSQQPAAVREAVNKLDLPMIARWKESGAWEHVLGRDLYKAYTDHLHYSQADFNAPENTSRALSELGIDGIKYEDAASRHRDGVKSHNYVVFDDSLIQIRDFEQSKGEGQPRGRITFGSQGHTLIELLERADRSTFLHETGHFYLNILHEVSGSPDAAPDIKADYATVRQWLGAEGDAPLTRDQHEQFARGFESYLMEGKAPSQDLRGVFYRFKTWLTGIYRQAKSLNVSLSPEVRGVFDRLVATEDEIRHAEAEQQTAPLFDDPKAAGLTDAQAESYAAAVRDAHQAAEEELTEKAMAEIRRQESKEWAALRKPIEAQVTKEVDADPVQRALSLLKDGTAPDGSPLGDGVAAVKLSRTDVEAAIGKDGAKLLPRSVYADDGVSPDVLADLFGFDSSADMLSQMTHALPRKRAIAVLTEQRMRLEHGERMSDQDVHEKATQAVRGTKRVAVLRRELEILASDHLAQLKGLVRAVAKKIPPTDLVRAQAREIIGDKPVRDIRPDLLEKAAARAAKDAREALLKGDVEGAFQAKQRELLATEVYQASIDARASVDDALTEFKKVFRSDEKLAGTRDMDLVNAARAVLASFGIGTSDKSADAYLEQMRKYDPDVFDTVRDMVDAATENAGDYKGLRYDDFRAMKDAVQSLWELSRRTRQIEIDGKKLDRQDVVDELTAKIEPLAPRGPKPGETEAVTKGERRVSGLLSMWAALRRVEHWVREVDGGADDGPFRRYVWNPINEGAVKFRGEKARRMEQYKALVDELGPTMTHEKIPAPELGYTFDGKRELLGALLHTGNESNLRKLLAGRHWGALSDEGALDDSRWRAFIGRMQREGKLGKPEYDFVQAVWDLFEETKPDAQRAHRDMYGHYFDEITAQPFATPFGDYKGGYYPAKADPFMTPEQGRKESATAVIEADNSNMFPSAGRGFTKSRVEYNRPLIIDANAIPTHLDAVLRFTHINPHIVDVARIMRDRTFSAAMDDADQHAISEMLDPWLRRTAQQAIDTPAKSKAGRAVDDMARRLRRNAGMQILSASLTTAAEQLTHVPAVALRVRPSALARGLWDFVRAPRQTAAEIHEKSAYMATRETAGLMEVRKAIDHIMLDPSVAERAGSWMNEHAAFLTRAIQHVEDHATWGGAYSEAVKQGMEETAAVRHADAVVRETLGAFEPESISRFEASPPVVKLFSMFYSFFNTKANFLKTEATNVVHEDVGVPRKAMKLAAVYAFGFMLPAVMATAIKQSLNGQPFDKDEDGPWDDVFRLFFGSQVDQAARMIPVAGPLAQFSIEHLMGGKPADLVSSPALSLIQQAAQVPADAVHAVRDREKRGEITDLFTLIGLVTGTPARPIAKPIGYLHDVHTGKAQPSGSVDFTRGLLTGR